MTQELLRFNWEKKRWLIWDTETNGLNLRYSLPFSIAYSIYENGRLVTSKDEYVIWPNYSMPADVAAINHYNEAEVKQKGKPPKVVFDVFFKELYREDTYSVGANLLNFDIFIVNTVRNLIGYKTDYSYLARLYDTNSYAKAYRLGRQIDSENRLAFMFKMNSIAKKGMKTSVTAMCREFDIKIDESQTHRAQYDCYLTFEVFKKLMWSLEIV